MITNEAANELAIKYYKDIYSFCCSKLKNTEDAGDVTQAVFLLLQERLEELEPTHIRSWLYCVADKKILEAYRERMKKSNLIPLRSDDRDDSDSLCREFDDYEYIGEDEIEKAKSKILSRLNPKEKELFLKIYEERKKFSVISQELNISEPAARVRACRLRAKIKGMVEIAFMLALFVLIKTGSR